MHFLSQFNITEEEVEVDYSIRWGTPYQSSPKKTLQEVRIGIAHALRDFWNGPDEILLVKTPPGTGKTYAAIDFAQEVAQYARVFYAMPRWAFYDDISNSPNFNPEMWYKWKSITHDGACLYPKTAQSWLSKNRSMFDMCISKCEASGYIHKCGYRLQKNRTEPIIIGVHQHIVTGLSIPKFDLIIVDENPTSAILNIVSIPFKHLMIKTQNEDADKLSYILWEAVTKNLTFEQTVIENQDFIRYFIDTYGPEYVIELSKNSENLVELANTTYWYLPQLLQTLAFEFEAIVSGTPTIQRINFDYESKNLLIRTKKLPKDSTKMVILDGTGDAAYYSLMLGKSVKTFTPNPVKEGRIFQFSKRLNGISQISDGKGNLTKQGKELLEVCLLIKNSKLKDGTFSDYKKVGLITFKAIRHHFEPHFDVVRHFGANRGTNDMLDCDCVIVAGTPQAPDNILNDTAKCLTWGEEHIYPLTDNNRVYESRPYKIIKNDQTPYRIISGFSNNHIMNSVISASREEELVQSGQRGRLLVQKTDLWLLTNVPLDEEIDYWGENYEDLLNVPNIPVARFKQYLELLEKGNQEYKVDEFTYLPSNIIDYDFASLCVRFNPRQFCFLNNMFVVTISKEKEGKI